MLISSAQQKSWQLELHLVDFFASITLTIVAFSPRPLARPGMDIFNVLGIGFTCVSCLGIKSAVEAIDRWDFQKAYMIWVVLFFTFLEFVAQGQSYEASENRFWKIATFSNIARATLLWSLVVPCVVVQVVLVRIFGGRLFAARQAALDRYRAEWAPFYKENARTEALVEAEACKAVLAKANARME
ncbi:hypothetical protein B0H11DRAFT_2072657 [Mycena galericulata]|nr:hypothetical protein B0H11DRAFT_2072657 [Mycena galericulata]